MKKSKNDKMFSFLSLGLIIMLMFCELACGNIAKTPFQTATGEPAVFADAILNQGDSIRNGALQNDTPMGDAPQGGNTNGAWGFVLAVAIGILLIAIVVGLTAKKRRPKGK